MRNNDINIKLYEYSFFFIKIKIIEIKIIYKINNYYIIINVFVYSNE
jgi:hypothetical protein